MINFTFIKNKNISMFTHGIPIEKNSLLHHATNMACISTFLALA